MERYVRVKDHESLVRDPASGAILNLDNTERSAIIRKRINALNAKQQIDKQNKEINNIKNELCEIKEMLLSLIQSKT